MNKKQLVIAATIIGAVCGMFVLFNLKKTNTTEVEPQKEIIQEEVQQERVEIKEDIKQNTTTQNTLKSAVSKTKYQTNTSLKGEVEHNLNIKHGNLYNSDEYADIPLSAITEMANLPENIQKKISAVAADKNEIFMLKRKNNKVLVVKENRNNIRHGIDFVEIDIPTGHQTVSTFGYNGKIGDSENDIWTYEEISKLPTKHTKYNSEGDVEFVETWNYDSENPVKYEMKNGDGKLLSVRKETLVDGSNLRIEHLLYDTAGNTKANITAAYEGPEIKRFTYYNADKLSDGASVYSEYDNGIKIKETVYTSDLKVKNIYESEYNNGEREKITVFDNNNKKLETLEK